MIEEKAKARGCAHETLEERYVGSITDGGAVVVCDDCGASWTPEEAPDGPGGADPAGAVTEPPDLESVSLRELRAQLAETDGGVSALPLVVAISYKHGANVGEMAGMYGLPEAQVVEWLRRLSNEPVESVVADPAWSPPAEP